MKMYNAGNNLTVSPNEAGNQASVSSLLSRFGMPSTVVRWEVSEGCTITIVKAALLQ
jgi:hypothetical protein